MNTFHGTKNEKKMKFQTDEDRTVFRETAS